MSRQPSGKNRFRNSAGDSRSRSGTARSIKRNWGSSLSADVSAGCDEFWRDRGLDPRGDFNGATILFGNTSSRNQ